MSKEKKNMVVPGLRFSEFENDGEWKQTYLGQISEIVRGGSPRPIEEYLTLDSDGLNWLKIGDVSSESKYITSTKEKVIPAALSKTREVNPGDLILSNSMSFGRPYILKIKTCIHDGWIAITQISDWVNKDYLYYFILTPASQVYFLNYSAGSGVQNLNADIIKLLQVTIPKNIEQQKIASCLSSLDDLITAHIQKLETLKAHKKGLMQQLFPAEGEKLPKLRFEEFKDSGEWEEKRLDEICEVNPSIEKLPEHFVYIDLESVERGILLQKKYIELENAPSRAQRLLKYGDVIFQMVRPYQRNNYIFLLADEIDYVASTGYAQLRAYESAMYLYQYLHNEIFVDKVLSKSTGSNYPAINSSALSEIPVVIPKPKEQQKIATCLSSLDELIAAQAEKIAQLKLHKKGLMQGLFPSPEGA